MPVVRCPRSSMVSVFFSGTVRPAASKTVTMTVIIFATLSADFRDNVCIVRAQHTPYFALRTLVVGQLSPRPFSPMSSWRWTKSLKISGSSLKRTSFWRVSQQRRRRWSEKSGDNTHPCREPLSDVKPFRVLAVIRTHVGSHDFVELTDNVFYSIFSGTPKRASATHNSSRSTESYAFRQTTRQRTGCERVQRTTQTRK